MISAVASRRSAGGGLRYMDRSLNIINIEKFDFAESDVAFFSAGSEVSEKFVPIAVDQKCIVIDNTSCFRMNPDIPLIVPEINFDSIGRYTNKMIISNPNCSTIQMVMALKPLHDLFTLREVVVSTYQSVSGIGQKGIDELILQTSQHLSGENIKPCNFGRQIVMNVIPQIDTFTDSGYTKEELKMINETRKILDIEDIQMTATCVRVPVLIGHAVSVFARFENEISICKSEEALRAFDGIELLPNNDFSTPLEGMATDSVFVSRLRRHRTIPSAISFWCVADNIRKGASLNAVQIAERICADRLAN
jgi:aspartate-semialdehyde dehydrogenase